MSNDTQSAPHVPAAFINALAEEGTREDLVKYLQQTWNELCQARSSVPQAPREPSDEMVENGCRGMYGKHWDGPPENAPGEQMKEVWRKLARKCLDAALTKEEAVSRPDVPQAPPEPDWKTAAEQAKAASDKVLKNAKIDPAQLQVPYSEAHHKYVAEHGWPTRLCQKAEADVLRRKLQLHAGDVQSLSGEVEMWRERALEAEEELARLRSSSAESIELTPGHIEMIIDGLCHVYDEFAHKLIDNADVRDHDQKKNLIEVFKGLRQGDTLHIL